MQLNLWLNIHVRTITTHNKQKSVDKYRFIVKCTTEDGFWMHWCSKLIIRFAELGVDGIAFTDDTEGFE